MKAIFCKECKWNNNGWCNYYECNGKKRTEVCPKYNFDNNGADLERIKYWVNQRTTDEIAKKLKELGFRL